ncbi:MAG TPA: tetratricopeptide repeat protein [Anaeromyxobacteraceae bacterium]|nr:tetratricopeptide repeat protein [Anaeromyxobacteraceae bacterium]
MAPSLVEKYEIILAADPKSRVFVELAKALLERGDHGRAAQVCRRGLEHHPTSVQGRVLLGRALISGGDERAGLIELESAAAVEPRNPYGWNLAAEVLVEKGLHGRAVGILEKALELQPSNDKIVGWLERARAEAGSPPPRDLDIDVSVERPETPPRLDRTPVPGLAIGNGRSATATVAPAELAPAEAAQPPGANGAVRAGTSAEPAAMPRPATTPTPGLAFAPATTPRPFTTPPPLRRPVSPRRDDVATAPTNPLLALDRLPDEPLAKPPPPVRPPPAADHKEAARIASEYEHQLRAQMMEKEREPPPTFLRRNWLWVLLATLVVVGGGGGALVYRSVREQNRASEVRTYVEGAGKGLARDTAGALREAARVLKAARELEPENEVALSLSAQVASLLAADFADREARELARTLAASPRAGEGATAARYLLASSPAELKAASEPLQNPPAMAGPLVQVLAARVLLARGDAQAALSRLEIAAKGAPPSLRALADLGDYYRERGELEAALGYYRAALAAHGTHPRSAIGAAEARLALRRELSESLATLRAVEADESSPPPNADRLRFELAYARLLGATGQRASAGERLGRAAERLGSRPELPAAAAEIQMASGAYGDAEVEARRAVRLAPRDASYRVLLAKAQAGRGRYRELLRESDGFESRELRLWRGVARYELHDYRGARAELERTRRESRMPAEAAAYYALADFGLGREREARALLEKLTALPRPPALAYVASGHLAQARGSLAEAEQDFRQAVETDPSSVEGHCALGRLLLGRGDAKEARAYLERAVALNQHHGEARLALGQALLALREPKAARDAFGALLGDDPHDVAALRGLSAAGLAAGNAPEARTAAERAVAADGKNPASWMAVGRAAQAQGDGATARRAYERALQLGVKGDLAAEARRRLDEARRLR